MTYSAAIYVSVEYIWHAYMYVAWRACAEVNEAPDMKEQRRAKQAKLSAVARNARPREVVEPCHELA